MSGRERWSWPEVVLLAVSLTALAVAVIYRLSTDPFADATDLAMIESGDLIDDVEATESAAAVDRKSRARQEVSTASAGRSTSSTAEPTTTASSAPRRPLTTSAVSPTGTAQSAPTTAQSTTTASETSTSTTARSTSTSEERAASTTSPPPTTAPGPAAVDDAITGEAGKDLKVAVMENDGEGAASLDKDTLVIVSGPAYAEGYRVHGDHIHYRSVDDFSGEDRLRYRICDENGSCDEATVVMTIEP